MRSPTSFYPSDGMDPNEWGDYLAGLASALAFLWLIGGYFLQRTELRLQREELTLQREELMSHSASLKEQVYVAKEELALRDEIDDAARPKLRLAFVHMRFEGDVCTSTFELRDLGGDALCVRASSRVPINVSFGPRDVPSGVDPPPAPLCPTSCGVRGTI